MTRAAPARPARRGRRRAAARRARRSRSGPRAARSASSGTPSTRGSPAASTAIPSGISCVRHGAVRPSRSTIRSTASFAIRRQVVSLPPVIVTMPARRLVQLRLARDVDRLLRVARRDQRPHARVRADDVAALERGAEERVDARRAGGRRRRRPAGPARCRRRSRGRSCRRASARATGSTNTVVPPAAGAIAPARTGRSADGSTMCVPRLGRITGTSASSCSSSGRSRSAHTPVALTTFAARIVELARRRSRRARARRRR